MSVRTLRPLSPLTKPTLLRPLALLTPTQKRTFLESLTSSQTTPSTLTATRTLPYSALQIYNIISDIESYPSFLPLLRSAHVTSWSRPDSHYGRKWPQQATLRIGYGDAINESFTSRVFCVPPVAEKGRSEVGFVEAVGGRGVEEEVKKRLEGEGEEAKHLEHHDSSISSSGEGAAAERDMGNGPLSVLKTKWTVKGFPYVPGEGDGERHQRTDVSLSIEYKFANIAYDVLSRGVASGLAERMVGAFEKRVEEKLGKGGKA